MLLGLVMVFWPGLTTLTLVVVLGVTLIIAGISSLVVHYRMKKKGFPVSRQPLDGWLSLLVGIVLVAMPNLFVSVMMILLGVLLAVAGIEQIVELASARRRGYAVPFFYYVVPVLILLIGFIIMFTPVASAVSFILLFGITVIVYGVVILVNQYSIRKK